MYRTRQIRRVTMILGLGVMGVILLLGDTASARRGWPYGRLPTSAELVSFLLQLPYIRRVIDASISVVLPQCDVKPGVALPYANTCFTGYPVPQIELKLAKLRPRGGR